MLRISTISAIRTYATYIEGRREQVVSVPVVLAELKHSKALALPGKHCGVHEAGARRMLCRNGSLVDILLCHVEGRAGALRRGPARSGMIDA